MNTLSSTFSGARALIAVAVIFLAGSLHARTVLQFGFSGSGDRDSYFGTVQPSGTFNDGNAAVNFQVRSTANLYCAILPSAPGETWTVLDDFEPDTVNESRPVESGSLKVNASLPLVLRTRINTLTSGVNGVTSTGGFLFGLNNSSKTASGYLAVVQNAANGNSSPGTLAIYNFTNGVMGGAPVAEASFTYGSTSTPYFLDLETSGSSGVTLNLFADSSISGSGNDPNRLSSADFQTVTPVATVSAKIAGLPSGWTGLYYNSQGDSASRGSFNVGNFYAGFTAASEAHASAFLGAILFLTPLLRWKRVRKSS